MIETVGRRLSQLPAPVYIAFSGGCDSTVLLFLAARYLPKEKIRVRHIDHRWSPYSGAWEEHCRCYAAELGLDYSSVCVNAHPEAGESPESAARSARYAALRKWIGHNETLLTAHHRDDQALTVLLQLLRGAGPAGLAGMPERAKFGRGFIVRPFLHLTAADIRSYARAHRLQWIEDSSNAQTDYDRNYLRLKVAPLIDARWPGWSKTLTRSAEHQAEATEILTENAASDYRSCLNHRTWTGATSVVPDNRTNQRSSLSCERLAHLSLPRRKQVLRYWFRESGCGISRAMTIDRIMRALDQGTTDGVLARQGTVDIHIYRGALYSVPDIETPRSCEWPEGTDLVLPELNTTLLWRNLIEQAPLLKDRTSLSVRFRSGGERCLRIGRDKTMHQHLKKIFQACGCPPWLRSRTPLIYAGGRLRLVWGITACD